MKSSQIRVGVCSYGYSTKVFHAPFISALPEYFDLRAFVERHKSDSKELFPNARVFRSCEEMFADNDIDLVIINTPSPTHFDYALKALNAGKHVVIDKPFTATTKEAETLIRLAESKNLKITVFHNRRWEGELIALKQVVSQNLLGKLIDCEFRFERFRNALNPKKHKEEPLLGNGLVYELCTHLIDQSLFLFGMPHAVYAEISKIRENSQIDDYVCITLYYDNNFKVLLKSSLLVADIGPSYILNGHTGSFVKYKANIQEEQSSAGMLPTNPEYGKENSNTAARVTTLQPDGSLKTETYVSPVSSYIEYYRQLGNALKNGTSPPIAPEDALKGLIIIEAAYKSSKEGVKCSLV